MLPVTTAGSLEALDGGVGAGWSRYLRRIARRDTDLEHASWLIWLAVTKPSMLYKVTQMHKQHTGRWARDDPGMTLLLCAAWALLGVMFAVISGDWTLTGIMRQVAAALGVFLGGGMLVASATWWLANTFLRLPTGPHRVEERVEWGYAFDVHCNAAALVIPVQCVHALLVHHVAESGAMPALVGNLVAMGLIAAYSFGTFRGFLALPFLGRTTTVLLYPTAIAGLAFVLCTPFGISFLPTLITSIPVLAAGSQDESSIAAEQQTILTSPAPPVPTTDAAVR